MQIISDKGNNTNFIKELIQLKSKTNKQTILFKKWADDLNRHILPTKTYRRPTGTLKYIHWLGNANQNSNGHHLQTVRMVIKKTRNSNC